MFAKEEEKVVVEGAKAEVEEELVEQAAAAVGGLSLEGKLRPWPRFWQVNSLSSSGTQPHGQGASADKQGGGGHGGLPRQFWESNPIVVWTPAVGTNDEDRVPKGVMTRWTVCLEGPRDCLPRVRLIMAGVERAASLVAGRWPTILHLVKQERAGWKEMYEAAARAGPNFSIESRCFKEGWLIQGCTNLGGESATAGQAAGIFALLTGQRMPERVAITGALDMGGNAGAVDYLPEKLDGIIAMEWFTAVYVPTANKADAFAWHESKGGDMQLTFVFFSTVYELLTSLFTDHEYAKRTLPLKMSSPFMVEE